MYLEKSFDLNLGHNVQWTMLNDIQKTIIFIEYEQ